MQRSAQQNIFRRLALIERFYDVDHGFLGAGPLLFLGNAALLPLPHEGNKYFPRWYSLFSLFVERDSFCAYFPLGDLPISCFREYPYALHQDPTLRTVSGSNARVKQLDLRFER